jgi:hypothetical protein
MAGEVTPRGSGDERLPAPELRASHEDRDRAVELLRMAAGDGRLSADELDQRLEAALTARTYGELAVLTRDLPAVPGADAAALGADQPKELIRIDCRSSTTKRDGRWLVPQRMEVRVASGTVTLDFTEAVITQPSLLIDAEVHSGRLNLITKPGIVVDIDDVAARSGYLKVPAPEGAPVPVILRIQVSGEVSSGHLTAGPPKRPKPPRRTFWQWLRRRPKLPAITAG